MTGRKKAREVEKSKRAAERAERDEEKARLRRLKIDEAQEKLNKFREAAGLRKGQAVSMDEWAKFLEAGFEDDNWDAEMAKRFGNDYYAEQDEEGGEDDDEENAATTKKKSKVKKPKWDDDLDIGDIVPDFDPEEDENNHGITLTDDEDEAMADAAEADGGVPLDEDDNTASKKPKKHDKKSREAARLDAKRQSRKERQKIEELVDAQIAQDLPTANGKPPARFRYRETSPSAYGLSALDILMADDAQLNSYVGLKKLASFRDAEKKRKDKKRLGKKARLREFRKEAFGDAEGPRESFEEYYNKQRGAVAQAGREAGAMEGAVDKAEGDVVEGKRKHKRSRKRKAAEATA